MKISIETDEKINRNGWYAIRNGWKYQKKRMKISIEMDDMQIETDEKINRNGWKYQ